MNLSHSSPRILLVEDNRTTSDTLVLFLSAEGYVVDCAYDGSAALAQFDDEKHDLVVLDLMLPDIDGLTVCGRIRAQSTVPVVMLTARSTEDDVVAGLQQGADDYVRKPFGSRELLARIDRCLTRAASGSSATRENIIEFAHLRIDQERRQVWVAASPVRLTRAEFDLLVVLARSPGRVFTRQQLLDRVLGVDYDGYERTIDTHIWSLRKKLGEPSGDPSLIQSEPGVGYRMSEPANSS